MSTKSILIVAGLSALAFGCKSDKGGEASAKTADKAADKPSLMLATDSPTCRKALKCCEAMVKLDKGKATPEDINLSCSGVGMASSDKLCTDFQKGYVMAIEGKKKAVPADCK